MILFRVFVSIEAAEAGPTGFRTIQAAPRTCERFRDTLRLL
jgi:hypothetical protein